MDEDAGKAERSSMWSNAAPFHSRAWLLWLFAAMISALLTRNPIYLALLLVVAVLVNKRLGRLDERGVAGIEHTALQTPTNIATGTDSSVQARGLLLRIVVVITIAVAVLKGLSLHLGVTVLFRLPEEWPVIGGPITLEGFTHAGLDALSLLAILAVFAAFSAGADYYALLRGVPASMHQVGLITSIGITFVPQTVTRFTEIREAQALRGHRLRRVGDLLPWIMPLLAGGMERSINLAEAMEARGFSRSSIDARRLPPIAVQGGIALGLGLTLAGGAFFAFYPSLPVLSWCLVLSGVALLIGTLWLVGKGSARSRYKRSVWRDYDTVLAVSALAVLGVLLTYRFFSPSSLIYDPLSRLRLYWPPFEPMLAVAIAALVVPALILGRESKPTDI